MRNFNEILKKNDVDSAKQKIIQAIVDEITDTDSHIASDIFIVSWGAVIGGLFVWIWGKWKKRRDILSKNDRLEKSKSGYKSEVVSTVDLIKSSLEKNSLRTVEQLKNDLTDAAGVSKDSAAGTITGDTGVDKSRCQFDAPAPKPIVGRFAVYNEITTAA